MRPLHNLPARLRAKMQALGAKAAGREASAEDGAAEEAAWAAA